MPSMKTEFSSATATLEGSDPIEILSWAAGTYSPDIAVSSSFQLQGLPLLHLVSRVASELPILFLDTGFHFLETLDFRDCVVEEWGLNLHVVRAVASRDDFTRRREPDLYRRDPDLCCHINKVVPMERASGELRAWVSGIRRDQASTRSNIRTHFSFSADPRRIREAGWRPRIGLQEGLAQLVGRFRNLAPPALEDAELLEEVGSWEA